MALIGFVWWVMPWGVLLDLPSWIQVLAWAVFAAASGWICSEFYRRLWRGQPARERRWPSGRRAGSGH